MPLLNIFFSFFAYFLHGAVLRFVFLTGLFGVMALLMPILIGYVAPFVLPISLTGAFQNQSAAVWFFVDFFSLGYGLPLMISAFVTRFLIRRLPVIG